MAKCKIIYLIYFHVFLLKKLKTTIFLVYLILIYKHITVGIVNILIYY